MKLIMMKGLPASGKTTKAKEIVEQGGDFVRVNRDLLREMLHFNRFTGKNEKHTQNMQMFIVEQSLLAGRNVIIDDTNLGQRHHDRWKNCADAFGCKFEVVEMETSLSECLNRDALRAKPVGEHVIMDMAMQYQLVPPLAKPYVICDIDGTVADCSHRQHHVRGEKKDWKAFFETMGDDTPRTEVIEQLRAFSDAGHPIVFVSARPEDYRDVTEKWLIKNTGINYVHLIMRRSGDKRPDTEVKEQIYNTYLKHYPIETVIDDRPAVIRMWESHDLPVINVGTGEEF